MLNVIPRLVESPAMSKLTPKQQRFVQEYLIDLNATAAYKRAGYKCGSDAAAQAHASRLLGKAEVQAVTQEHMQSRSQRTEITTDLVVQETWNNYQRCTQAGELVAANKALELLGRHTGAFPNRHEHSGINGGPISIIAIEVVPPTSITELRGPRELTAKSYLPGTDKSGVLARKRASDFFTLSTPGRLEE
jgi:hypothetical protein